MPAHARVTLYTIWCCFLVRAVFYCSVVPLWEGYDEYSHFAVIQYVAIHPGLPDPRSSNSPRNVADSLKLTPAAWILHDRQAGRLSYEEYWALGDDERRSLRDQLLKLRQSLAQEFADPVLPLYEAQQPPLYYWLMAAIYRFMAGWSIPSAVWTVRVITACIASAVIPIAYFVASRIFQHESLTLGIPVVIACMPELFFFVCRVSNEGLAIALGSLLILLSVKILDEPPSMKQGAIFGMVLGAALLTKAYFLALVPFGALVLFAAYRKWLAQARSAGWQALAAISVAAAISVWWYARNVMVSGTLTGHVEEIAAASQAISLWKAAQQVNWLRMLDFAATSHIWLGGWSFLVVRAWMYHLMETIMLVAFAGIGLRICIGPGSVRERRLLLWMSVAMMSFLAALCYNAIQAFRALGSDLTVGYYLYALVVPEVILLVAGLGYWIRVRTVCLPVKSLATLFLGLDVFGTWFVSVPYYVGLVQHVDSGRLPVLCLGQLAGGGMSTLLQRLAFAGPAWMSTEYILVLSTGYFFSAGALLWIAYRSHAWMRTQ